VFNVMILRLKRFLKNEVIIMAVMLGMGLMLTYVFGIAFSSNTAPKVMTVDEDQSGISAKILGELAETGQFVLEDASLAAAQGKVEDGMAFAVVHIPRGFSEGVASGSPGNGIVMMKNNDTMETWSLLSALEDIAGREGSDLAYLNSLKEYAQGMGICVSVEELQQELRELRENPVVTVGPEIKPVQDQSDLIHFVLGFTLFFSTFTIAFTAADILQDKLNGTWNRLMITPTRRCGVLAAHLVTAALAGIIQVGIMVLAGHFLFGVEWGSHIGAVMVLLFAFIAVVTCFGLFLAAALRSMAQLEGIVPVVLVSTAMLGGCMWPLDIITFRPLLYLANITPQKWALQALESLVAFNAEVSAIYTPLLVLFGMAAFWFLLGLWKLNKNYN